MRINKKFAINLKTNLKLKQRRDGIVRKLGSADEEEREELTAELEDIVSERFDLIIQKKAFKYEGLKKI